MYNSETEKLMESIADGLGFCSLHRRGHYFRRYVALVWLNSAYVLIRNACRTESTSMMCRPDECIGSIVFARASRHLFTTPSRSVTLQLSIIYPA